MLVLIFSGLGYVPVNCHVRAVLETLPEVEDRSAQFVPETHRARLSHLETKRPASTIIVVGRPKPGCVQLSLAKVGAKKAGASEVSPGEVSSTKIGLFQISPRQVRSLEIRAPKVRSSENGFHQLSVL